MKPLALMQSIKHYHSDYCKYIGYQLFIQKKKKEFFFSFSVTCELGERSSKRLMQLNIRLKLQTDDIL